MDKLFLELLNLSIAASWLILVVLLLRPMLKRAPRAIVCALWLLVGLRLALPFSIESALSLIPSRETVSPEMVYAAQPMIDSGVKILDQAVNPVIVESFAPSPAESVNPLQVLNFVGGCVWLMGLVLMLGYSAVSYLRRRLRVREAVLVKRASDRASVWQAPLCWASSAPVSICPEACQRRTDLWCWPMSGPTSAGETTGSRPWASCCWRSIGSIPWCGSAMCCCAGILSWPVTKRC